MSDPEQNLLSVRNRVSSEDIGWFKRGLAGRDAADSNRNEDENGH